jgi:hypothetical protein
MNDGLTGEQVADLVLDLHSQIENANKTLPIASGMGSDDGVRMYWSGAFSAHSIALGKLRRMGVSVDAIIEAAK